MLAIRPHRTAIGLSALLPLVIAAPLSAQTTPCEAVLDPVLAEGIAEANARLRLEWRMLDGTWVTAYRLEGEKPNPFDAPKQKLSAAALDRAAADAPPTPIDGFASAIDVRCNATASSARPEVALIYSAGGLRFKEGKGRWSAPLRDVPIAVVALRRAGARWAVIDRSADKAVLPPDARRSPPPETLAAELATLPWATPRSTRRPARR